MAASRRAKIISKIAQLIGERAGEIALREVRDNGKTIATAKGELGAIVDTFEFYAGAATKNYGETLPPPIPTYLANTVREPVGVVGAIVPWNFPLLLASWKVAPALAAGCTIVLKPSSVTPLTAIELGQIALEAGVPEGVLNVVTGSTRPVGAWMVEHPGIDKIAFTGSTATGKSVAAAAAQTLKRVTLELGGKSPSIVFDDADIDAAVAGALYGVYYNAGQCCEARTRILLQSGIYDRFVSAFVEKAKRLRVGDPEDPRDANRRDHAWTSSTKRFEVIARSEWPRARKQFWVERRPSSTRASRAECFGFPPRSRRRTRTALRVKRSSVRLLRSSASTTKPKRSRLRTQVNTVWLPASGRRAWDARIA